MNLDRLLSQPGAWLRGGGPDSDIVLSSRIRLARNLAGYPFISRMSEQDCEKVLESVKTAAKNIFSDADSFFVEFKGSEGGDADYLLERQLISREFLESPLLRGVFIDRNEDFSLMVNEEDHLRLQGVTPGFDFSTIWERVNRLDTLLEREIPFAFDEKRGYLTACPTNIGTGIRISVMLHLPAVQETGEIKRVFRGLGKINLAVRGMYGEGSQSLGDFYQISNQTTLGLTEEELTERLADVIPRVIDYERRARNFLLTESREQVLDQISRALGLLYRARKIEIKEALELLSKVRLGVHLELQNEISIEKINDLVLHIQPAHLRKIAGEELVEEAENIFRADYLRKRLADPA